MNPSWKFLQEKIKPCVQKKVKLPKIMNIAFFFSFLLFSILQFFVSVVAAIFPSLSLFHTVGKKIIK